MFFQVECLIIELEYTKNNGCWDEIIVAKDIQRILKKLGYEASILCTRKESARLPSKN